MIDSSSQSLQGTASQSQGVVFIRHAYEKGEPKSGIVESVDTIAELIDKSVYYIIDTDTLNEESTEELCVFGAAEILEKSVNAVELEHAVPVSFGYDHSEAIGSVCASLANYPNCKVLWIDSHADINSPESTITGNLHGMPLHYIRTYEPGASLHYIGLCDLDPYEVELIHKQNIPTLSSPCTLAAIEDFVRNYIGESYVHLSIDIDVLRNYKATGCPSSEGIDEDSLHWIIKHLGKETVAIDIAEINFVLTGFEHSDIAVIERLLETIQDVHTLK